MLWAGLVFIFFSISDSKLVPYILPVFPPLALLIGRYCAASWNSQDFPGIRPGYTVFLIAALLLAAAFIVLPYYRPASVDIGDIHALGAWRIVFAFTLAAGAACAWSLAKYRRFRLAFIAVTVFSAFFLIEINAAAPLVDTKSVKTLAIALKTRLKPGDEVASYQTYYQDLPVYLERRITVVDWKGELEFGTSVEDTSQWMIDSATFWKRWQGHSTMYMMTSIKTYDALQKDRHLKLYPLAQNSRNILVSNKEEKE